MQLSDVTKEMVATLGEDHWESKFEKRPFAARKPGAHPVGTDSRTKKQKEDAMIAGEKPKPKPKPSMHAPHADGSRLEEDLILGGGGTGMHFVAVAAAETEGEARLADAACGQVQQQM